MDISTLQLIARTGFNAEFIWLFTVAGKAKNLSEPLTLPKQDIFLGLQLTTSSLFSHKWASMVMVSSKNAGTPGDQLMSLQTKVCNLQL
jgi:hypothetical protein